MTRPAEGAALADGEDLAELAGRLPADPFAEHPFAATIPAERASFEAERTRLTGIEPLPAIRPPGTPRRRPGRGSASPHRAGYAWWRYAQARLAAGQEHGRPLRTAAGLAAGHAPLLAEVRKLALRARIPLDPRRRRPAGRARPGTTG